MPSTDGGKRGAGVRSSQGRGSGELRRFEPVSDDVVLAAVERAERHREREREGVMMSDIAEHLGFVHGSWTTRRLRPQIEAFIAVGLLVRSRRHGIVIWGLTASGRRRGVLEESAGALDAGGVRSDVWFALAERLQSACWQLGSATYCLSEWAEPDDSRADADDRMEPADEGIDPDELGGVRYRRGGRRNVWKWADA